MHIYKQTTTSLRATYYTHPTCPTLPKLLNLILTPHSSWTQLYWLLATVGLVYWQRMHPDQHCHLLIADWFLNGEARRRRIVSTDTNWWVKEVSNPSSVDYLTNLSTETRTPIDRHKSTVMGTGGVYFKSQTSIFTYQSIYQRKEKTEGYK